MRDTIQFIDLITDCTFADRVSPSIYQFQMSARRPVDLLRRVPSPSMNWINQNGEFCFL